jgi:spermidine synthase
MSIEAKTGQQNYQELDRTQVGVLMVSILIVALCGIAYELIIGTISSYLLGNSVYQFSLTIGLFMFAMGIGSYLSKLFMRNLLANFITVEILVSVAGGLCSIILFLTFPMMAAVYTSVMYSLIIIIGTLVGLEIPILTRILSRKESIRTSIAHVLSLDYFGALIGSVLFPLFLLPHLGLMRSSFAIGLINAGTAVVNTWFFRKELGHRFRGLAFASFISLVLLIVLTGFGTFLSSFAEQKLYFADIIYKKQSLYQRIIYTESTFSDEHRLYIDGHIQFSDRDEYRYHEALVHPIMSSPGSHKNVLILGGGDGMVAREVLKYPEVQTIHLVDLDPAITDFCKTFLAITKINKGSLSNIKLTIFNQDAFTFINQPGLSYDRVIIDLPDPHNEALNKLYSREFYTMIRRRMSPEGLLVSQSSSPFYTRHTYWCIAHTLAKADFSTHSYQITVPSFGIWGFHIGAIKTPPRNFAIQAKTKYLTSEIMDRASIFGKDINKVDTPVNTIMEPKLYHLYLRELRGEII